MILCLPSQLCEHEKMRLVFGLQLIYQSKSSWKVFYWWSSLAVSCLSKTCINDEKHTPLFSGVSDNLLLLAKNWFNKYIYDVYKNRTPLDVQLKKLFVVVLWISHPTLLAVLWVLKSKELTLTCYMLAAISWVLAYSVT